MNKREAGAAHDCRFAADAQQKRRAWLYARAGSPEAPDAHPQLSRQLDALRRLARDRRLDIAGASCDAGTGPSMSRPGLREMAMAAREGRFDVLLTADLTRIGQNAVAISEFLLRLKRLGVGVITIKDGELAQGGILSISAAHTGKQTCVVLRAHHAPNYPYPLVLPAGRREMEEAAFFLGLPSLEEGGYLISEAHGALSGLIRRPDRCALRELSAVSPPESVRGMDKRNARRSIR